MWLTSVQNEGVCLAALPVLCPEIVVNCQMSKETFSLQYLHFHGGRIINIRGLEAVVGYQSVYIDFLVWKHSLQALRC